MRTILVIVSLAFLVGCAAVKQAKVDVMACLADPICREEAATYANNAKDIAVDVSGVSPIPLSSNVVGGVVYGVAFLVALIKGGKKKREEVVPPS